MHQWHVYQHLNDASAAAAAFIADKIEQSLRHKSQCHIILPGGRTPQLCLDLLREYTLPWEKIHWYPGDERCYPLGHDGRNDVMLEHQLWSKLPQANSHPIPAELGPDVAARLYRKTIGDVSAFDIAFLGMGEDGHTASLFPGNQALHDANSVVAVKDSPKPPDERVSMGISTLKKAHCRMILASGQDKQSVVEQVRAGAELPVNMIGDIEWFIDNEAAGK